MRRWLLPACTAALLAALTVTAAAQRYRSAPIDVPIDKAPPYDGRFTFARLKYTTGPGGYYFRGLPAWAHGYPDAERNLTKILKEISQLDARGAQSDVVARQD